MKELLQKIKELPEYYRNILIFTLLTDNVISFAEISKMYVQALEQQKQKQSELITELGYSLVQYKDKETAGTQKQLEQKANKAIIESGLFKGTPYEEKLIKSLK